MPKIFLEISAILADDTLEVYINASILLDLMVWKWLSILVKTWNQEDEISLLTG
jgi:hypothetical protein